MSGHTPGPWEWGWRKDDEINPGSVVSMHRPSMPISVAMCPRYRGPDHDMRWDADARLIAAAPDLLAALESVRGLVSWCGFACRGKCKRCKARRTIDAAIAKATEGKP